jgi:hypothetical protein
MLFSTDETKANMLLHIDKYSDNYTTDATVGSLREVFEQMDKLESEEEELNEEHERHLARLQMLGMCFLFETRDSNDVIRFTP